jgi:hypothetical protein
VWIFDRWNNVLSSRHVTARTIPAGNGRVNQKHWREMLGSNFDFTNKRSFLYFVILRRVFCAKELALRSSEGTYAFECAAKSFLAAIISMINCFSTLFHLFSTGEKRVFLQ